MKKERTPLKKRFQDSLVSALEVPGDLAWQDTLVTLTGTHQAVVENYRKLVKCTDQELILRCREGCLILQGKHLRIHSFRSEELTVFGQITGIRMESR